MKKKYSRKTPEITVGLDLGEKTSYYRIFDSEGEVIEEGRIRTRERELARVFQELEKARIGMEVGSMSAWVSRLLRSWGHEVIVANSSKLRLIYENKNKDDRVDADYLGRVARIDPQLLRPIYHRGPEAQQDLQVLRLRAQLVESRTKLINTVRSTAKQNGQRLKACSAGIFARKAREEIQGSLKETSVGVLEMIEALTEKIREYDRRIEELAGKKYRETGVLRQIRGVGALTALAFVLTLEDSGRFSSNRSVGAFLGLCPQRKQSGEKDPQLRITKAGDKFLRRLLLQCAQYMMGPFGEDSDLRRHGEKIAARGGKNAKKRALVAVARKLSVLMLRLWKTGEVYQPLYNAQRVQAA